MEKNKVKRFRNSQKVNLNHPQIFMPADQQALFNSKKSSVEEIYPDKIDHAYDYLGNKDESQR